MMLIWLDWSLKPLTDEQKLVLRDVAAKYVRDGQVAPIRFSHELCEGILTQKSEGTYGTYSGTFFHADLGVIKGERWTCDFLLPRNTEHISLNEDSIVFSSRPLRSEKFDGDGQIVRKVRVPSKRDNSDKPKAHPKRPTHAGPTRLQ